MKHVQHTVRLSPALNRALASVAQQRGLSSYQALKRAIETGLGQMTNAPSASVGAALSGEERATLSARLALIEALTDRSLFTASAAYVYARRGALRGDNEAERVKVEAALSESVKAAYQRQRALAAEAL